MRVLFRLLGFVRPHKRLLVWAYVALLFSTALQLVLPRLLGESIDRVLEAGDFSFLVWAGLAMVLIAALRGIFAYFENYLRESLAQHVTYDIRNILYNHLQRMSFAYHDEQQTGQLMSRATADVEALRFFVSMGIVRTSYLVLLVLAVGSLLLTIHWPLALICLLFLPVVIVRAMYISGKLRAIWTRAQERTAELGAVVQENLTGMKVVKVFAQDDYEKRKFSDKASELAAEHLAAVRVQASNTPLMNFLFMGITVVILWFGGREIIAGRFTTGELTQFIIYLAMLQMPVRMMGFFVNIAARAVSSGQRIFEVLDADSPVEERPGAIQLKEVKGRVALDHVSFQYNGSAPVLRDISFEIEPGQVVALLGATGSGKSTVVHLLPRFYDVSGGRVLIDGTDVRDVTFESLRRNVGIVQQDVFLFSSTIRDNIAYGAVQATDEQVVWAAKTAEIHDFIKSLPDGYDTWVGERGMTLSGGQKQRVAIARTLLMDPRILILDDSTASVDTKTESRIRHALQTLIKGRTTFVIAQRLSTVKNADVILVLEDGRIVQRGNHAELVAVPGPYREVYEMQLLQQDEASRLAPAPEALT
jgi:ATP-binding cassette subfamily B protein